eukprot:7783618-Lingulodinium_polyedra.AAC.1
MTTSGAALLWPSLKRKDVRCGRLPPGRPSTRLEGCASRMLAAPQRPTRPRSRRQPARLGRTTSAG